jgi:serine/threonine-protein kinase
MAVSIVSLAALVIVTTALAVWGWLRPGPAMGVARYGLAFLPGQELVDGDDPSFALAPDGSWIVYVGPAATGNQLWIKRRDALAATPVPGTNQEGVTAPAVSPDGEWIVFQVGSQLRKVPRDGGSPITVADSVEQSTRGVAWLDDGTIVYHTGNRLRRVSHLGGTAEVIWSSTAPAWAPRLPAPLPSARGVLFSLCDDPPFRCAEQSVWVLDFRSGEAEVLERDASRAWYTPTGHVVFVRRDGGVFAAPFDLGSLKLTGPAVPVLEGVKVDRGFYPDFAMSPSGSLLMLAGSGARIGANAEAVWVYRDGRVAPVDSLWRFRISGNFGGALSPDGTRLAITLFGEGNNDIWIKELKELERGPLSRLTHNPGVDMRPRWKPDGRSVSFVSVAASEQGANGDVFVRRADGTLPANLLLDFEEYIHEALWSSDGKWLVLRTGGTVGTRDIWAQRVGVDSAPRRLLASDFDELAVALSPDGRWLAYQSDETGETEVYVRPFPDITADKVTVSVGGGSRPLWSHSGRELFYVNAGDRQMIAARIRTTPTFGVVERRPLFPLTGYFLGPSYTAFDISPDDQRFLMIRQLDFAQGASAPMLVLVENWFEELRARMAGGR